jgi:hypothetical protein
MKFIQLIILFSISFCLSCKSQKPASKTAEPVVQKTPAADEPIVKDNSTSEVATNPDQKMQSSKDTPYRFIVSFISIGEGTDRNGKEILDSVLNEWKASMKKDITYETIHWGREGETDFCFQLPELNETQQQQFIKEIKEKFKGHDLIQFTENEPCLHKR